MAYETKALLADIAKIIAKAKSIEEIYRAVADLADIEGAKLPTWEEATKETK